MNRTKFTGSPNNIPGKLKPVSTCSGNNFEEVYLIVKIQAIKRICKADSNVALIDLL